MGLLLVFLLSSSAFTISLSSLNEKLEENIDQALPAVVKIRASSPTQEDTEETGTGFIINDEGYVITSYHLLKEAEKININLKGKKEPLQPEKVGADPAIDLAVLQIVDFPHELPTLKLGDSDTIQPGHLTISIGHPYGFNHTLSWGIVSSTQRQLSLEQDGITQTHNNLIQTDAAINPGNSGGPLLNLKGEAVGITTAVNVRGEGISFAVPINEAKESLAQIKEHGKVIKPWLGIYLQNLGEETREYLNIDKKYGVLISHITPDSPADKAGLRSGDIILEFEEQKISDSEEVIHKLNQSEIGSEVELTILRNEDPETYNLTIEEQPKDPEELKTKE